MWRRTTRDRVMVSMLAVATIVLLTLDFRTSLLDGLQSATAQVVGVFQAGVRTVARPIEEAASGLRTVGRLRKENQRLRRENELLRRQAEAYRDVLTENERLRRLMDLEGILGLPAVRARVIGASLSGLERSALIDKGRQAGIRPQSAVISPEGLVGRVVWAGARVAKVLLVTDPQSSVGVRIDSSHETGVVTGTGSGLLRLELVSRAALDEGAVKRGDVVLTSGYEGGIFPPGIPVGRVEEVLRSQRGTTATIRVRPFAALSRLDVVSVLPPASGLQEAVPSPSAAP